MIRAPRAASAPRMDFQRVRNWRSICIVPQHVRIARPIHAVIRRAARRRDRPDPLHHRCQAIVNDAGHTTMITPLDLLKYPVIIPQRADAGGGGGLLTKTAASIGNLPTRALK